LTPWQTHKEYGKRATLDTFLSKAKNQMGLAHIKTNDFLANAHLFQCAILAYNTIRQIAPCSSDRQLLKWEVGTIRTFHFSYLGRKACHWQSPTGVENIRLSDVYEALG